MTTVRLSKAQDLRYHGVMEYLIAYDYNAGQKNVYNVFVLSSGDPVIIGRELPLDFVRSLIADYEKEALKLPEWIGERKDVLKVKRRALGFPD